MLMKEITVEGARRALREAVDTQGEDFVYNPGGSLDAKCTYVRLDEFNGTNDGWPRHAAWAAVTGCLIGTALDILGVDREFFADVNDAISNLGADRGMSDDVCSYFQVAQTVQDSGGTWGAALMAAESLLGDCCGRHGFSREYGGCPKCGEAESAA